MLRLVQIVVLAACAACSPGKPAGERGAELAEPTATAPAAPRPSGSATARAAVSGGGMARIESEDGLLEFTYSHPAAAGAIPRLRAVLEAERDRAKADAQRDAREDKAGAATGGYEFHPHALGIEWKVVTQTPRFLSLSQSFYSFTGGAHGNYGSAALLWDRPAGRRLAPAALFTSPAALKATVAAPFCAGLDRERRKKGIDPPETDSPVFPRCIDPVEDATMILGSSNGRAIDRIGFLVDPYVAGPYAEGDYEVTLPVTPAVLAAVKPEYRSAFAAR